MKNETLEQFIKEIKRGIKKFLKNYLILSKLGKNTESRLKSLSKTKSIMRWKMLPIKNLKWL